MASLPKSKHTQQHQKQRKYKPMLCSLSNNQLNQPLSPRRHSTSSSASTSTSSSSGDDPSSPRVGCMGQVKMKNNNLVGFHAPIISTSSDNTINNNCNSISIVKYINFRLKGFFSRRSLVTYPTPAKGGAHKARRGRVGNIDININKETQMELNHPHPPRESIGSGVGLCRCRIENNNNNTCQNEEGYYCMVNLKEMDPPLPVVKRVLREEEEEESLSLWKRRSREVPLKSIQICQVMIQHKAQFSAKTV